MNRHRLLSAKNIILLAMLIAWGSLAALWTETTNRPIPERKGFFQNKLRTAITAGQHETVISACKTKLISDPSCMPAYIYLIRAISTHS